MDKRAFAQIRRRYELSIGAMSDYLGVEERSIRRYEDGTREISNPVSRLMTLLDRGILSADYWEGGE